MSYLILNLDELFEQEYLYSDYDIGGRGHSIEVREEDKEKFLEDYACQFKKRVESLLEEIDEDDN